MFKVIVFAMTPFEAVSAPTSYLLKVVLMKKSYDNGKSKIKISD